MEGEWQTLKKDTDANRLKGSRFIMSLKGGGGGKTGGVGCGILKHFLKRLPGVLTVREGTRETREGAIELSRRSGPLNLGKKGGEGGKER